MLGYLLVRGGVHALAYAKALEELTGVTVSKMLNNPSIPNSAFPIAASLPRSMASRISQHKGSRPTSTSTPYA